MKSEKLEDTKRVIRSPKSYKKGQKDKQCSTEHYT